MGRYGAIRSFDHRPPPPASLASNDSARRGDRSTRPPSGSAHPGQPGIVLCPLVATVRTAIPGSAQPSAASARLPARRPGSGRARSSATRAVWLTRVGHGIASIAHHASPARRGAYTVRESERQARSQRRCAAADGAARVRDDTPAVGPAARAGQEHCRDWRNCGSRSESLSRTASAGCHAGSGHGLAQRRWERCAGAWPTAVTRMGWHHR